MDEVFLVVPDNERQRSKKGRVPGLVAAVVRFCTLSDRRRVQLDQELARTSLEVEPDRARVR